MLLWSTVATGFKLGLELMEPVQLLLIGTCWSAALFWVVALVRGEAAWPRGHGLAVLGFAALNPTTYYLILLAAYDRLPAQIAQPLNYTWAITLALLAVPLLKQPLSRSALLGMLVSYGGVLLVLNPTSYAGDLQIDATGVALAIASTVIWALYWIQNTKSSLAPLPLMLWSFTLAVPLLAALCWQLAGWPELNSQNLGYGAWVGLIEMGITFLLWQSALRSATHTGRIGQLIFIAPFLSLVIIGSVLDEPIQASSIVGLSVIVLGLWITQRGQADTDRATAQS